MKLKALSLGLISGLMVFTSCSSDDDGSPDEQGYEVPSTYEFSRNNETTVSFSGQSDRLNMLSELSTYLKTDTNWPLDATKALNMYSNTDTPFENEDLNSSTKQLKDKTAASRDYFATNTVEKAEIQAEFEAWLEEVATVSVSGDDTAVLGEAGIADGSRLVDGNGLEIQQVIEKSLMGACFLDQILNNYLSDAVLNEGDNLFNNNNEVLEEGKNYTTMEHKWDEAYGYVYGAGGGLYWDKYIGSVDGDPDFVGIADEIDEAFRKGRAAIVNLDYDTRDEQIVILREKLSLIAAVRAVYYLQDGEAKLTDVATGFHALSEAYGFIYSLQFTRNPATDEPYFTREEVQDMLTDLTSGENGLWDIDHLDDILDELSAEIATEFGFTVEQAASAD